VQLVIKIGKKALLKRCCKKVVKLEFTGGDCSTGRPGLDLVAVVDVSGSMDHKKMEQLKTAMQFVVLKLSPIDRLSIVTFSSAAMRLCLLRQIMEASQKELQILINGLMASVESTNIMDMLQIGLTDPKVSSRCVDSIMLMSACHQSSFGPAQVNVAACHCTRLVSVWTGKVTLGL